MPEPISWTLIAIFLFLSFFFSASETALACCNRFKLQIKADAGSHTAKLILKVINNYDRALTTVLIGNNIVAIATSAISTVLFVRYFEGTGLEESASIISSIIITFAIYIIGDNLPKVIAKAIPDTFSRIVIYPIYAFMLILYPITILFSGFGKLIDIIFKSKKSEGFTEEDFENAVEKVSNEGLLEDEQSDIIQSAMDFTETKVKEVFTPLNKMVCINYDGLTNVKLNDFIVNTKYSRLPVYNKDYNHFMGVLLVKNYLRDYQSNPNLNIKNIIIKPYYVSQNVLLDDLFKGFKKHHTHLAFVVDSEHKVIGMVTMEDVLEELVSDIGEQNRVKGGNK